MANATSSWPVSSSRKTLAASNATMRLVAWSMKSMFSLRLREDVSIPQLPQQIDKVLL